MAHPLPTHASFAGLSCGGLGSPVRPVTWQTLGQSLAGSQVVLTSGKDLEPDLGLGRAGLGEASQLVGDGISGQLKTEVPISCPASPSL